MDETTNLKKERIPLFLIFKDNGQIKTEVSADMNDYELYGFLKVFLKNMEENLRDDIVPRTDDEEIL